MRGVPVKSPPLHQAIVNDKIDMLGLLLDARPDLEAANQNGATPLHVAAWVGSLRAIELLVAKGAKLQSRRSDGLTPMLEAQGSQHPEAADLLRRLGATE